jgi:hypothetical protein
MPKDEFRTAFARWENITSQREIAERTDLVDTPCWLWTGATASKGYGHIHHNYKDYLIHRLSWIRANAMEIPEDRFCLHLCNIPGCFNPQHLYLGTQADNVLDRDLGTDRERPTQEGNKTMTALYGCKRTQDHETFLIAKFDENLSIEASYFVGPKTCQCQGWQKKKTCRHLTMRTMFMMSRHTDDGWFLDFENRRWREYPNLLVDGTARDFNERLDTLALGEGGYLNSAGQTLPSSAPADVGGVCLSTPTAPEVKSDAQSPLPSGVQTPEFTIKRRKGL